MDRKLKNALLFALIAWPVMMIAAYLLRLAGGFASTNFLVFGLLALPALFAARLITLQFFDRSGT